VIAEGVHQIQNDENTRILPNGTLIVAAVKQEDEGWYTCTAENKGK
jgi:Immunoglobulin I-set domain.